MSFNEVMEMNNVQKDNYQGQINEKSAIVEIFSRMAQGKEIGEIKDAQGRKVDVNAATKYIKDLAWQADAGNLNARTELNEIRRLVVWPLLERRLNLLGIFGTYRRLNYGDTPVIESVRKVGELARAQANRGDVVFGVTDIDAQPIKPVHLAAGHIVDYRRTSNLDMQMENMLIEQIVTNMWNKASGYVLFTLYNAILNNPGVKFFSQGTGITQSAVDNIIRNIRRFGPVSIFGDYSVTSQLGHFAGYAGMTPVYGTTSQPVQVSGISQALVTEFLTTGLIANYKGASVTTIENGFDYSHMVTNADGTLGYDTLFPQGFLFFAPTGIASPVQNFIIGGLTSLTGTDVQTGSYMTRFDLALGSGIASNRLMEIGLIVDNSFPIPQGMTF